MDMPITVTESNLEQKKKEAAESTYTAYEIGEYYYSFANYGEAVKWYEKASTGSPAVPMALYAMGYACQNGEGTAVDLFKAFQYYEAAAQKDLPQACYNLAYFYQNGIGVSRDLKRAKRYCERASESLKRLVDTSQEAKEQVRQVNLMYSQMFASVLEKEQKWVELSNESAHKSKKIGELEAFAADCSKKVSELQDAVAAKDTALALQEERCAKTESLHNDLVRMIDALNHDLHRQQIQIDDLEKRCSNEASKNVYMKGQNTQLREERDILLKSQDTYQKELISAQEQIGSLNNGLIEVTSARNHMEKEIETYKERLNKTIHQRNGMFVFLLVLIVAAIALLFL